ncbi:hypothetical protein [Streptomyces europaeiscabiei]|uniref:hypothetical protein n=1 Tax=Streptomyces europaeiscabiei TaxID=146819 RepID=UPI002E2528A8|nr:hypothetical protein OG858_47680 [Streptomyces europaeiscabiei]
MSQGDVLRLLIPAVLVLSGLGVVVCTWWERRHPSPFQPDGDGDGGGGAGE